MCTRDCALTGNKKLPKNNPWMANGSSKLIFCYNHTAITKLMIYESPCCFSDWIGIAEREHYTNILNDFDIDHKQSWVWIIKQNLTTKQVPSKKNTFTRTVARSADVRHYLIARQNRCPAGTIYYRSLFFLLRHSLVCCTSNDGFWRCGLFSFLIHTKFHKSNPSLRMSVTSHTHSLSFHQRDRERRAEKFASIQLFLLWALRVPLVTK